MQRASVWDFVRCNSPNLTHRCTHFNPIIAQLSSIARFSLSLSFSLCVSSRLTQSLFSSPHSFIIHTTLVLCICLFNNIFPSFFVNTTVVTPSLSSGKRQPLTMMRSFHLYMLTFCWCVSWSRKKSILPVKITISIFWKIQNPAPSPKFLHTFKIDLARKFYRCHRICQFFYWTKDFGRCSSVHRFDEESRLNHTNNFTDSSPSQRILMLF